MNEPQDMIDNKPDADVLILIGQLIGVRVVEWVDHPCCWAVVILGATCIEWHNEKKIEPLKKLVSFVK